jgi:hypothetical protein
VRDIGIRTTVLAGATALALLTPAMASAETIAHDLNMPMSLAVTNTCTGEEVFIEGNVDLIFLITASSSGAFHYKIHTASKGDGFGGPLGTRYVYSDEYDEEFTGAGVLTSTQNLNQLITSVGGTDNFFLKVVVHVVVHGLEVPTVLVDKFETGCRG